MKNFKFKSWSKIFLLILLFLVLISGGFTGGTYYGWLRFGAPLMKEVIKESNQRSYYPKPIVGSPSIPDLNGVYQRSLTFATTLSPVGRDNITVLLDDIEKATSLKFNSRLYSNQNLDITRPDIPYPEWVAMTEKQRDEATGSQIAYSMEAVLATISINLDTEKYNLIKKYFIDYGFRDDRNSPIGGQKEVHNFWKGNLVCKLSSASANDKKISILCGYYDEPQIK